MTEVSQNLTWTLGTRDDSSPRQQIYIPTIAELAEPVTIVMPQEVTVFMYILFEDQSNTRYIIHACASISLVGDTTTLCDTTTSHCSKYHWGGMQSTAILCHAICGVSLIPACEQSKLQHVPHRKHHCSVKIFQVTRLQAESYHWAALSQHWLMTAALCHPLLWRLEFLFSQHEEAHLQAVHPCIFKALLCEQDSP